ncbi:MAG: phosphoadenylyl-sulfate reductase [Spirochaetales bacterium]|nr:phosphoadenylyl-sulfate reductase [Spirochaetales bacterium]
MPFEAEALSLHLQTIEGPVALAFSYQAEDAAALHLLLRCGADNLEVFTLDTHKLFPETEEYHRELERFFNIPIHAYYPDPDEEKELEARLGEWGMRESPEKRRLCCDIRKVRPLRRILAGKNAWVTGLRAAQSVTRSELKTLEWDEKFGLVKINPLADWSDADLWAYIQKYGIPLSPLYGKGFRSIGCAPCTRAVKEGEDIRAGRWWWENPEHKECGLHIREKL